MRHLLLVVYTDTFRQNYYECRHCLKVMRKVHEAECEMGEDERREMRGSSHQSAEDSQQSDHRRQATISAWQRTLELTDRMIKIGIDLARQYKFPRAMLEDVDTPALTGDTAVAQQQMQSETEQQ